MTTTLEKYAGWYRNYSTRPTKDVEIIETQHICAGTDFYADRGKYGESGPPCHKPIQRRTDAKSWDFNEWQHLDGTGTEHVKDGTVTYHAARPAMSCSFCGNNEPGTVHYRQQSYSDETSCDRCGGVSGYAIGD